MRVARFNDFPHPRILFESIPDDVFAAMEPYAGYARRVTADDRVDIGEFDLLVTFESHVSRATPELHVLSFGANIIGDFRRNQETHANEVLVAPSTGFTALAEETIAPYLPLNEPKYGWHSISLSSGGIDFGGSQIRRAVRTRRMTVLVTVGSAFVTAGLVAAVPGDEGDERTPGRWLMLPSETKEQERWLAEFIRALRDVDSERFPGLPDWQQSGEWSSAAAQSAAEDLAALRENHEVLVAEFKRSELDLIDALTREQALDKEGVQRLLTEDGNSLVAAVAEALTRCGFDVQDMDEEHTANHGSKLEDLRATTPARPGWTALVEVKGYTRGAKVNDLPQLMGRPTRVFVDQKSKNPDALWQVVNPERGEDPGIRHRAIDNDNDLDQFADADGVLIDTRDLFRAIRDIDSEPVTVDEVRNSLLNARRRWVWPVNG